MDAAIHAEALVKHFGEVKALNGVSLDVKAGTVLGLLGPNGAGKTTIVRILTTILKPTSGRAVVGGFDVSTHPQDVRRTIGLAGQYAAVDENLTGRENLSLIGRLNHMAKSDAMTRAGELLDQFRLSNAGDRPARTYSGGMRRRLDLGATLVTHPSILLLDEPTAGLDPASRQDLWDVISSLVADGTTVLLTTQYLEEADRLADDIVVITSGTIAAQGTPAALKARLGETMIEISLADSERGAAAVLALAEFDAERHPADASIVALPLKGGSATIRAALNLLADRGIEAGRLELREPTLDDVFLSLTGGNS